MARRDWHPMTAEEASENVAAMRRGTEPRAALRLLDIALGDMRRNLGDEAAAIYEAERARLRRESAAAGR